MKARLISDEESQDTHNSKRVLLPAGTVIDGPDSWYLVALGVAEPADPECEEIVSQRLTPETIAAARLAQQAIRDRKIWHDGEYVPIAELESSGETEEGESSE